MEGPTANKPLQIGAALGGKLGPPQAVLDHFGEGATLSSGLATASRQRSSIQTVVSKKDFL
jgi:hypothetical protein